MERRTFLNTTGAGMAAGILAAGVAARRARSRRPCPR